MNDHVEINCLGMKCPRPIIEIAKAARKSPPGTVLIVKADDLAFESDVQAWVENAHAKLLNMEKEGNKLQVHIQLAER